MPRFDKSRIEELHKFLYNSYTHDARLENIRYECAEDIIRIEAYNPIFDVKTDFTFCGIEMVYATKGNYIYKGSRETIISLTAEDDFSYLKNYIKNYDEKSIEDSIYLLFGMLSGGELHIVSREVIIESDRMYSVT